MSAELAYADVDQHRGAALWLHDRMRVGVLGPLVAQRPTGDPAAAEFLVPKGQRARDTLAVLVQRRGRPVPPELVRELVWSDAGSGPPGPAGPEGVAVVHTVVARIRRQLGADLVVTHDSGYLVNAYLHTDEDAATSDVEQARSLLDRQEYARAAHCYRSALDRWRGLVAYEGVDDQLVAADRARLAEWRTQTVEALVALQLEHLPDQIDEAAVRALALCREHPLRERPHQLAMLSLFAAGRQAEALEVYDQLRRRLRDELGVDPGPGTQDVHRQVLAHAETGPRRPPPTPPRLRAGVLPGVLSPIVGRRAELEAIEQALATRRLVTLVGPGGVGKSRLLAELGRRRGPEAVRYLDLSGLDVAGIDDLAEVVAQSHGIGVDADGAVASLVRALSGEARLWLVDEAEWVLEPLAALVGELLDGCPELRVVVTSRRPLELVGERLLAIEPLPVPAPGDPVETQLAAPAVALLAERFADRGVVLTADRDAVAQATAIATAVDGLPLGLELAAAHAGTRTLAELVALVEDPLDLTARRRSGNVRHGSLRRSLQWSVTRLDPRQRAVLGRLAVFSGRFDLAAAVAVADSPAVEDDVAELVRDALVLVDRSGPARLSFRLLRTVRQLAAAELEPDELAAARSRHREWYAARWRGAPRRDDLVADVRDSYEEYLAALASAVTERDAGTMADLALTLSRWWLFACSRRPGLRWTTRVLDTGALTPRQEALVRAQRAALALHHDRDVVLTDTALATPVLLENGDLSWAVTALVVRALEVSAGGDHAEALACARHGVEVAEQVTLERQADALGVLAVVQAAAGRAAEAEATIAAARQVLAATGSAAARIAVGSNLAFTLVDLGRPAEALRIVDEIAPHVGRVLGGVSPDSLASTVGWAALGVGDVDRARVAFAEALGGGGGIDRQTAELLVGAACATAIASAGSTGPLLIEAVRELCRRVELVLPAAMAAEVERALAVSGGPPVATGQLTWQPTEELVAWVRSNLR